MHKLKQVHDTFKVLQFSFYSNPVVFNVGELVSQGAILWAKGAIL